MHKLENKTKIVATLGPASSNKAVLKTMIESGVNVCRINFSHGSYEAHQEVINTMKLEVKDKLAHVLAYMGYSLYHNPLSKARDKYNAYKEKK